MIFFMGCLGPQCGAYRRSQLTTNSLPKIASGCHELETKITKQDTISIVTKVEEVCGLVGPTRLPK